MTQATLDERLQSFADEAQRGAQVIARLRQALGADIVKDGTDGDFARHVSDFTNVMPADIPLPGIAYPRTTEQVSQIMAICNEEHWPVVPQGGLTSLCAGGLADRPCLLLSLERMRGIEELDEAGRTMTVLAGTVLETVQRAADEAGFLFPLDLGGRGTAQVGGNAATNAGGNRVLRYGMMRDLILGVEAVLPDGTIVSSLNVMIKNNAGYDLKHLFIGSEGTLGVITRLVLRMFPKPRSACTAVVAVEDYAATLELLKQCNSAFASTLSAFEVMWPDFYQIGTTALGRQPPLPHGYSVYALVEVLGTDPERDAERFEEVLGGMIESGLVKDAVIAQSDKQRQDIWAVRDCPGEWHKGVHWPQVAFDVSLPTRKIGDFIPYVRNLLLERWPDCVTVFFGHLADSNLHLSARVPRDPMPEHEMEALVYKAVGEWGGSITAEHGIGSIKREFLHHCRTPEELALMRTLKRAMDPNNILNPGKVI
ncbi:MULTISPECIES: FAD-binding oxidoreductase [Sphingobium]|uniref:FAD-binding oxidoreductase n=1 Tax=Sphingobium TaxID=165695 RepID=UPI0015EC3AD3|nr:MULTISPECIES: FAD-binding oxidoreductase [Sphingobium]MCW2362277.1 FAD/FMN-containing dehydrogenase [Sphingobium sp. B10D3B]MCW2401044.1 FAD/FMN-containing dehydrogenase [Sphingobium sp. B10D7B]MCW2408023.1 FAD/FMN-containing dehydrogenase [Sphingobium xanthum]